MSGNMANPKRADVECTSSQNPLGYPCVHMGLHSESISLLPFQWVSGLSVVYFKFMTTGLTRNHDHLLVWNDLLDTFRPRRFRMDPCPLVSLASFIVTPMFAARWSCNSLIDYPSWTLGSTQLLFPFYRRHQVF